MDRLHSHTMASATNTTQPINITRTFLLPVSPQTSRFLNIPPEIRLKILEMNGMGNRDAIPTRAENEQVRLLLEQQVSQQLPCHRNCNDIDDPNSCMYSSALEVNTKSSAQILTTCQFLYHEVHEKYDLLYQNRTLTVDFKSFAAGVPNWGLFILNTKISLRHIPLAPPGAVDILEFMQHDRFFQTPGAERDPIPHLPAVQSALTSFQAIKIRFEGQPDAGELRTMVRIASRLLRSALKDKTVTFSIAVKPMTSQQPATFRPLTRRDVEGLLLLQTRSFTLQGAPAGIAAGLAATITSAMPVYDTWAAFACLDKEVFHQARFRSFRRFSAVHRPLYDALRQAASRYDVRSFEQLRLRALAEFQGYVERWRRAMMDDLERQMRAVQGQTEASLRNVSGAYYRTQASRVGEW